MTSKAERKRRKKAATISLPGGETVPQHVGRGNGGGPRIAEAANKSALKTRQRLFAGHDGPEDERAFLDPRWGDSVGRLILSESEAKHAPLWNAAQHARKTQAAYDRAIGAPSRHAQCLRILAPVDAMQADAASPAPDDRSLEERVRDATRAQMQVEGWIGHTDSRAVSAFKQSVINDPDGPVRDWPGVLACLQCIAEGLKGETVKARVRGSYQKLLQPVDKPAR